MMTRIAAFAMLSLIVTVTPGPDSLLVLRGSLLAGQRTGARVAGGAASGSLAWGICSAAGLTAILAASAQLYRAGGQPPGTHPRSPGGFPGSAPGCSATCSTPRSGCFS